jgi:TetR/AcrR family transcriptional repressor of nem operon
MATATLDSPLPETKRALLDAALKLMLAQGFTATSVDEISAAAQVTKGSFFHYFESKEDLAKAVLEYFFQHQCQMFAQAPFRQKTDPLEKVFGRMDLLAQLARSPQGPCSCLIGNFAQELAPTHPEMRDLCATYFERGAADFARDLAEAKKAYPPAVKFDPESVGRLYLTIIQGSMILGKAAQSSVPFAENVAHLRKYLEYLFGRSGCK